MAASRIPNRLRKRKWTNFTQYMRDRVEHMGGAIREHAKQEAENIRQDLELTTPIDTGAAAGTDSNLVGVQRRALYPSHPGFGVDPLGWKTKLIGTVKTGYEIVITNPMWRPYLRFLEYGAITPKPPANSHFVRNAIANHRRRRKEFYASVI